MATIINYPSALEYWLYEKGIPYHYHFDHDYSEVKNKDVLKLPMIRKDIIKAADTVFFSSPVHVAVVTGDLKRNSTEKVAFHKLQCPFPENSFRKITDELYIVSPEMCFLQAAEYLSVPELVVLANNLCAIYILDECEEYGQRKRTPVTTVDSIRSYINQADNIRGVKRAKIAIQYALDRSNSPVESKLAAVATLPVFRGGFGLLKPQLNFYVRLTDEAKEFLGYSSCCCDMVWQEKKVVLEYDSNLSHLDINQHFRDKKRITALTASGYKVICVTAEQISTFADLENLFLQARKTLGMRTHKARMDKFFELRWDVVHKFFGKKPVGIKQ